MSAKKKVDPVAKFLALLRIPEVMVSILGTSVGVFHLV
jgi:hypothetical protein